MRKLCYFCIAILTGVLLASSCEKVEKVVNDVKDYIQNPNQSDSGEPGLQNWWDGFDKDADLSVFQTPAFADDAVKLTFDANAAGVVSLEFTESGLYVILTAKGTFSGTYTVTSGTYNLSSLGSVEVGDADGNKAKVSFSLADITGEIDATIFKPTYKDDLEKAICRTWRNPRSWAYLICGDSALQGRDFSYCDFKAFSEWLYYSLGLRKEMYDDSRLNIPEQLNGTEVTAIALTGNGTFIVTFSGDQPWIGTWSWKDKANGEIDYDFSKGLGGNFHLPKTGTAFITPHEKSFVLGSRHTFTTDQSWWLPGEDALCYYYFYWKATE